MEELSEVNLITFKAISDFTRALASEFEKTQRSLALYRRLIEQTTIVSKKAILKHIKIFREFCMSNRTALKEKEYKKLEQTKIHYSDRVYINLEPIFRLSDKDTQSIIWKHLLTISALVDPTGKAKEVLKESSTDKESKNEQDFLSNIIDKVENHVDPDSNPMEAVSSIMQSGVFTELIGSMNDGLNSGNLDLGKLMGTVQGMVSSLGGMQGENSTPETNQMMGMVNNMMGKLNNLTDDHAHIEEVDEENSKENGEAEKKETQE